MFKKITQIMIVLLFFSLFGYFFGEEYWNFHGMKHLEGSFQKELSQKKMDFSLDGIAEIQGEINLFITPNLSLLTDLVQQIDEAQEKIYLEMYIFTERDMRDALIRAHNRGVDVKILLENNPYKAPYLNDKHYNSFKEAEMNVEWSDPLNYSLNHSKLLIIDEEAYISTGNFSYSLFKYNRDFLVSIRNEEIVNTLEDLFLSDFEHIKVGVFHTNLVISPDYSRLKLERLLNSAQESIDFYFPYMADEGFEKIIFQALEKGIKMRAIVEKNFYRDEKNETLIKKFQDKGGKISYLGKYKLHGKAILVDKKHLYIGSINFSRYSLDENREIGILIQNTKIIKEFQNIFESDLFLWQVKNLFFPLRKENSVYNRV